LGSQNRRSVDHEVPTKKEKVGFDVTLTREGFNINESRATAGINGSSRPLIKYGCAGTQPRKSDPGAGNGVMV
jgi:hypothetical protein